MKFQFDIADRERTVEVLRLPHGLRVVVNGRSRLVDAVRVASDVWSLLVRNEETGEFRSVEAAVVPRNGNGAVDVYLDGQRLTVAPRGGLGRRARAAGAVHGGGPQRVTAPMPGKVVRVLVKPGDDVQARQGLVVVEAMKMENELRAAGPGRVRAVFVREGQSVEAGSALVAVE